MNIEKLLEKHEKNISELTAARESDIKSFNAKLAEAERRYSEAEQIAADKYNADITPEEIVEARKAINDAASFVSLFRDRKADLITRPIISDADYESAKTEILNALSVYTARNRKRILEIVAELESIRTELGNTTTRANKLLHALQHDLYMDDCKKSMRNGAKVYMANRELRFNGAATLFGFLEYILSSGAGYVHNLAAEAAVDADE